MRRTALAAAVAIGLAVLDDASVFAAAAPEKAAVKQATIGKLQKYDAATKTLTITTRNGSTAFTLVPGVRIRQGSKTLTPQDLAARIGRDVKVYFSESGGQRNVDAMTIASVPPKAANSPQNHN